MSQDKKDALLFRVHQKKRRLHILEEKVAKLVGDPGIHRCFGGKKLFNEQFHSEGDGHSTGPSRASHDEWLDAWRRARSSEFVVLGSKDETSGCQGCTATLMDDGSLSLRLRLPNALTQVAGTFSSKVSGSPMAGRISSQLFFWVVLSPTGSRGRRKVGESSSRRLPRLQR